MVHRISVGHLRQNPTDALDDVADGAVYEVTKHNRVIARLVPAADARGSDQDGRDKNGYEGLPHDVQARPGVERLKASPLYTRERSDRLVARMLEAVESGRDRMGTVAEQ